MVHTVVVDYLFVLAGLVDSDDFGRGNVGEDFIDVLFLCFRVCAVVHAVVFEFAKSKEFEIWVVEVTGDNDVSCMVGISQYNTLFANVVDDLFVAGMRDTHFGGFILIFVTVEIGDAPVSLEVAC